MTSTASGKAPLVPGLLRLRERIFALPHHAAAPPLAYLPLAGLLLEFDEAGLALLRRMEAGLDPERLSPAERRFAKQVEGMELFRADGQGALSLLPEPGADAPFRPTHVTLFLTARCNLRCGYCYAHGGSSSGAMEWEVARSALDTVMGNAVAARQREVSVIFHGGGEPTMALPMLQRCVAHARQRCKEEGLEPVFSLGTNGVVPPGCEEWLVREMSSITLSIDGMPEIQDRQRPARGGQAGSSAPVLNTIERFDALEAEYGLRVTVTRQTESRIPEIVEYLCRISRASMIQLEPVELSGRALSAGFEPVDVQRFVDGYLAAMSAAAEHGVELRFGGTDPDRLTDQYCSIGKGGFVVTELGAVGSCYETASPRDPRNDHFSIGRFKDGAIELWPASARRLRAEAQQVKQACRGCWARYSCAGDCHAKMARLGEPWSEVDRRRCYVIREIARAKLLDHYGFGLPGSPSCRFAPTAECQET